MISRITPPISVKVLRTARDKDEPITVCSSVVSVVRRERISPVLAFHRSQGSNAGYERTRRSAGPQPPARRPMSPSRSGCGATAITRVVATRMLNEALRVPVSRMPWSIKNFRPVPTLKVAADVMVRAIAASTAVRDRTHEVPRPAQEFVIPAARPFRQVPSAWATGSIAHGRVFPAVISQIGAYKGGWPAAS